jgi:hypothetical protein
VVIRCCHERLVSTLPNLCTFLLLSRLTSLTLWLQKMHFACNAITSHYNRAHSNVVVVVVVVISSRCNNVVCKVSKLISLRVFGEPTESVKSPETLFFPNNIQSPWEWGIFVCARLRRGNLCGVPSDLSMLTKVPQKARSVILLLN